MATGIMEKWDNRWKIVSLTFSIFTIAFVRTPPALIASLLFSVILLSTSRLSLSESRKALNPPLILLLFMSPFILFTPGDTLLWQYGVLKLYKEGLLLLFTIAMKSTSIFLIFTALIHSSQMTKLMQAMKALGIPGKMVSILISTYRYIFLYMGDLEKMLTAARLKGFNMKKGFSHTLTSADILLSLLIRSYEQSDRVQSAMVLRGFTGDFHWTESFITRWYDPCISGIIILSCSGILYLEYLC
jgi:cobalt/nickel transport system permease protein